MGVLLLLGLASTTLGGFLGIGFAIPALGLSPYGRNSVELTLVAEGVAAVIYLVGAGLVIIGCRLSQSVDLGQHGHSSRCWRLVSS